MLFIIIIRSPTLSRNRFNGSPSPSRKGFSKNLYKGFIVVNYIHNEIDSNEIPAAYFKLRWCDCLLLPKRDCLGGPGCDFLVIYLSFFMFYSLV